MRFFIFRTGVFGGSVDLFRGGAVVILSLIGDAHLKDTYQEINTDLQRYDLFFHPSADSSQKRKVSFPPTQYQ